MNIHKYARLTPHGRGILVRGIDDEGLPVAEAAHASGVTAREGGGVSWGILTFHISKEE